MITKSYAAYNKSENIRLKSSSGGIFYTFAKSVIDEGGVVFGASFDEEGQVFHKVCTTIEEIYDLMQSKYVQSNVNTCYKQVRDELLKCRKVLFCGTPCQVYGLLSYLDLVIGSADFRENLITIDFICHGVPSRMVWREYLKEISQGRKIKHINFRDKTNGWRDFSLKIDYLDGTKYLQSKNKDPYVQGFLKNLYLRPCCYECRFRGIDRFSDFTIADFWSVHNTLPDFFDDKGTSILMVHNDRAMHFLNGLQNDFYIHEIANELVAKTNSPSVKSVLKNPKRKDFFKELRQNGNVSKKIIASIRVSFLRRVKRKILRMLNN